MRALSKVRLLSEKSNEVLCAALPHLNRPSWCHICNQWQGERFLRFFFFLYHPQTLCLLNSCTMWVPKVSLINRWIGKGIAFPSVSLSLSLFWLCYSAWHIKLRLRTEAWTKPQQQVQCMTRVHRTWRHFKQKHCNACCHYQRPPHKWGMFGGGWKKWCIMLLFSPHVTVCIRQELRGKEPEQPKNKTWMNDHFNNICSLTRRKLSFLQQQKMNSNQLWHNDPDSWSYGK